MRLIEEEVFRIYFTNTKCEFFKMKEFYFKVEGQDTAKNVGELLRSVLVG